MTFTRYFSDEIFTILLQTDNEQALANLKTQQKQLSANLKQSERTQAQIDEQTELTAEHTRIESALRTLESTKKRLTDNQTITKDQKKLAKLANAENYKTNKDRIVTVAKRLKEIMKLIKSNQTIQDSLPTKLAALQKKIKAQTLKGEQGKRALIMWHHLSEALRGACADVLDAKELTRSQLHLFKFLTKFEALFGTPQCKPNFHFSQELLKECIDDFGPMHVTWCFAFERLNGILGAQKHNFRNLERILPRRFMALQVDLRDEEDEKLKWMRHARFDGMWANLQPENAISPSMVINRQTMRSMTVSHKYGLHLEQGYVADIFGPGHMFWKETPICLIDNKRKNARGPTLLPIELFDLLQKRFDGMEIIPLKACKATAASICLWEDTVGAANTASWKNSFIFCKFKGDRNEAWNEWAGQVQGFYEITVRDSDNTLSDKLMAYVRWYVFKKKTRRVVFNAQEAWVNPYLAVYSDQFEPQGKYCWISVTEISASFVPCFLQGTTGEFMPARVRTKSFH
jgi:hypothetical protein